MDGKVASGEVLLPTFWHPLQLTARISDVWTLSFFWSWLGELREGKYNMDGIFLYTNCQGKAGYACNKCLPVSKLCSKMKKKCPCTLKKLFSFFKTILTWKKLQPFKLGSAWSQVIHVIQVQSSNFRLWRQCIWNSSTDKPQYPPKSLSANSSHWVLIVYDVFLCLAVHISCQYPSFVPAPAISL